MLRITRVVLFIGVVLLGPSVLVVAQPELAGLTPTERAWVESVPTSEKPPVGSSDVFETRFGEAPFPSVSTIYEKPQVVEISVSRDQQGGLSSLSDTQAVFPGSPENFATAIASLSSYNLLDYRTILSEDKSPSDPQLGYHLKVQVTSTGALGINRTYLFATNNFGEQLPDGADGFKWDLDSSYQNAFSQIRGSWYLKPLSYQGRPCTYLRYFNHSVVTQAPPVPLGILTQVAAEDYRELLTTVFTRLQVLFPGEE